MIRELDRDEAIHELERRDGDADRRFTENMTECLWKGWVVGGLSEDGGLFWRITADGIRARDAMIRQGLA